jgi:hypothetical protein
MRQEKEGWAPVGPPSLPFPGGRSTWQISGPLGGNLTGRPGGGGEGASRGVVAGRTALCRLPLSDACPCIGLGRRSVCACHLHLCVSARSCGRYAKQTSHHRSYASTKGLTAASASQCTVFGAFFGRDHKSVDSRSTPTPVQGRLA